MSGYNEALQSRVGEAINRNMSKVRDCAEVRRHATDIILHGLPMIK